MCRAPRRRDRSGPEVVGLAGPVEMVRAAEEIFPKLVEHRGALPVIKDHAALERAVRKGT